MQVKKPLHKKLANKKTIITAVIVVVLLFGYGVFAFATNNWPFHVTQDIITPVYKPSSNNGDTQQKPADDDTYKSPTDKTPPKYDTPKGEETPANTLTGVINYKNISDGNLTIRNTIDQKITTGNCKLVLTSQSSGKMVTRTADVIANPSSSTCKGFSVPTSDLSRGVWDISITIISGDQKGTLRSSVDV